MTSRQDRAKDPPPQPLFIIFCWIGGVDKMAADELGAAQQVLADVCEDHATQRKDDVYAVLPSVYGRLLCVTTYKATVEIARAVVDEAAARGVPVAVGIDEGRLKWVQDIGRDNLIGPPINRAARLAKIAQDKGLAIIATPCAKDALCDAIGKFRDLFGEEDTAPGKRDETFPFHALHHDRPNVADLAGIDADPATVHALVYDVARFSGMSRDQAWDVLTHLRDRVVELLHSTGSLNGMDAGQVWYAPAGDGGVLVFSARTGGDTALIIAERLADECRGKQDIRIGIATGPAVILNDCLPVGKGILRADELSALPPTGHICVDRKYWEEDRGDAERARWQVHEHEGDEGHDKDADARIIFPAAGQPGGAKLPPPGAGILTLCPRCVEEATRLARDATLAAFVPPVADGAFAGKLRGDGASEMLFGIHDRLQASSGELPTEERLRSLLAALAPLTVPAAFVRDGRQLLGLDPARTELKGGVIEISRNTDDGADAVIRAALYDMPCRWAEDSFAVNFWPRGERCLNVADVPPTGTTDPDRVADLRRRLQEACLANDMETAKDTMRVWLRTRVPLSVLCNTDVVHLLDSLGPDVKEFALFLSKADKAHSGMRVVLTQLQVLLGNLYRARRRET